MCSKAGVRRTLQLCAASHRLRPCVPHSCLLQTPSGSDALFVLQALSRDLALSAAAPCDNAIARLPELLQQFDLNIGFTIPAAKPTFFGDGESSEYSLSRSDMSHEGMRSSAAACSDHDSVRGGGLSADGSDVDDESEDHAY